LCGRLLRGEEKLKLNSVYRITTFVPPEHLDRLIAGIVNVTPLTYGRYDQVVWWSAPGVEQFCPRAGSNPTLGQADQLERSPSIKLEFAIERDKQLLDRVLQDGIAAHHPWEEPVIYITESTSTLLREESSIT
jgi:hypothetical protein